MKMLHESKEEICDDGEITAEEVDKPKKLDGDALDSNEGNVIVDAKEYSEQSLEKPRKLTEPEINYVNLPYDEVYTSCTAQVEKHDIKKYTSFNFP